MVALTYDDKKLWEEVEDPETSCERLAIIVSNYRDMPIYGELVSAAIKKVERRPPSHDRDKAFATFLNIFAEGRYGEYLTEELLRSPTVENDELLRIVYNSKKYRVEAARRMVENGLTDTHRKELRTFAPEALGEADTLEGEIGRGVHRAVLGR
ncbi:MAG: hypothetical protein WCW16_03540 [Candidatus Magasanikbacteria bacterium]